MVRGHDLAVEVKHAVDSVTEVDGALPAPSQGLPQCVVGQGCQTSHRDTVNKQAWRPYRKKDIDMLERVQRRPNQNVTKTQEY